jgi:hypothetical protein
MILLLVLRNLKKKEEEFKNQFEGKTIINDWA